MGFAYVWRYTTVEGTVRPTRCSNLGCSSAELDVLSGRAAVTRDISGFILPGSKRLIAEEGMFGNNSDVLPPDQPLPGPGFWGRVGGRGLRYRMRDKPIAEVELCLDFAILEDGLCLGPDESGLFESLTEDLELHRSTAQEVATALRNGASEGRVFEILRPLARNTPPPPPSGRQRAPFNHIFANMAIYQLVNAGPPDLLAWFEQAAQPPLRLHRPS